MTPGWWRPVATCAKCGHRATRETMIVHRPGRPSVQREALRCQRPKSAKKGRRCPVVILSETPLEVQP